jgi:hypothetical protein
MITRRWVDGFLIWNWIIGGSIVAAMGVTIVVLFILDAARQPLPGAIGVAFVLLGMLAVVMGVRRRRARKASAAVQETPTD